MRWALSCMVCMGLVFVGCGGGGKKKKSETDAVFKLLKQEFENKYPGKTLQRDSALDKACYEHAETWAYAGTTTYNSNLPTAHGNSPQDRANYFGYSGTVLVDNGHYFADPKTPTSDVAQWFINAGVLNNSNCTKIGIAKYYCPS